MNKGKKGEWKLTPAQCETRRVNRVRWIQEHPEWHRQIARRGAQALGSGAKHPRWRGGLVAYFLARFEPVNDGCWLWRGPIKNSGYGRGRMSAHRFSYELFREPIPEGLEIDHICHVSSVCKLKNQCPHRRCVNPWHMEVVTHDENVARKAS